MRAVDEVLNVDDETARMLVDLGVATAVGLSPQTGSSAALFADTFATRTNNLGDLTDDSAARNNLSLGTAALADIDELNLAISQISGLQTSLDEKSGTSSANTFTVNQVISVTDNSNAALRVTQLGTGNAFVVEDSASPDSSPFVIAADGRVGIGTTTLSATALNVAGNSQHTNGTITISNAGTAACIVANQTNTGTTNNGVTVNYAGVGNAVLITNTGTGNSFVVEDSANPDSTPFIVAASGNVGVKTASPSTDFEVNGNAKVSLIEQTRPTCFFVGDHSSLGAATSGAGASTQGNTQGIELNSPTTVVGYATRRIVISNQCPRASGSSNGVIPWAAKRIIFGGIFIFQSTWDSNCTARIYYGRTTGYPTGDTHWSSSPQSVEVRWTGTGAMTLHCATAAVNTSVTSTFTPTTNVAFDLRVEAVGGTVTMFVNGLQVAQTTGGPNADGSSVANVLGVVAENIVTALASSKFSASNIYFDSI
jgi:hypothetical protein